MACAREAENVALRLVGARQMPLGLALNEGLGAAVLAKIKVDAPTARRLAKRVY